MLKHKKILWHGFLLATGVAIYTSGISALMANGQRMFGSMSGIWGGAIMLTLICASAAIIGSLIFARPIFMVIAGEKKQGLLQLIFTIGWLVVFLIVALSLVAIFGENNPPIYY